VAFVVQPGLWTVGDPVLLRNVLANLLWNAWKFTSRRPKARIEVGRCEDDADMPVYFVKDDGAGFDMEDAGRLFTAFQRLHSDDEFSGTGIGLATAQRIVQSHGGRIWADARPGGGATFFFTLGQADPAPASCPVHG
jgi:light-regulated signal transduction histidine kinase (bacteriophytochrome)